MTDSSRKGDIYVHGHAESVVKTHQDRTAENSCPHLLPTLKQMATVNPTLSIIDVGCGSGSISVGLAAYIPQGKLTAFDLNESALAPARVAAKTGNTTNIEFATGTALAMPYPDDTFDVVHASQMLAHLTDREQGLKELYRICKPGGVVAIRDMCINTWCINPEPKWWRPWHDVLIGSLDSTHLKGRSGSQLLELCLSVGLKADQIKNSASCWVWAEPEKRIGFAAAWAKRTVASPVAEWALKEGGMSKGDLEDIAKGWIEWSHEPAGWLGVMNAEVLISK